MPGSPGKLLKVLADFFLQLLRWIFQKTEPQRPDPEAQLNLPANIIYGEKLPAWMSEAPKSSKTTADGSQPLRHSGEWAEQKAEFLRSPGLKRKSDWVEAMDKRARSSGHCVHFSDFQVEYPRTHSGDCLKEFSLPPTIRIEDWSTRPSPGISVVSTKSLTVVTTSHSRSNQQADRDSLTVPRPHSPGCLSRSKTSKNRKIAIAGTGHKLTPSRSKDALDGGFSHANCSHHGSETHKSNPPQSSNVRAHDSESDGATGPSFVRPARTSKPILTSSLLDLFETTSFSAASVDPKANRGFQPSDNPDGPIHRETTRETLTETQHRMTVRSSQQRRRTSSKFRFTPKRNHSNPLSTMPLWDNGGTTGTLPSEMAPAEGRDYSRHTVGVVAATPGRSPSGFQHRPSHRHTKMERAISTDLSNDLANLPYPYVFDLDDYFQEILPPATPPRDFASRASSLSHYESQGSFDTPTPAPRNSTSSSTANLLTSTRDSLLRASQNSEFVSPSVSDSKGMLFVHRTPAPVRKSANWSFSDTDEEEQSFTRSEYSDDSDVPTTESNSSEELPLAKWIVQRLVNQGGPNKRTGIAITQRTSATSNLSLPMVDTERNSVSSRHSTCKKAKTGSHVRKNGQVEMEEIHASLRSRPTSTKRQRNSSLDEDSLAVDDNWDEDSFVSLIESYSSGSTLSHRYHPHQWKARSPRAADRRLEPLIDSSTESESGIRTPKAAPPLRFSSEDDRSIITVDRTPPPPAWVLPPRRKESPNTALLSSRLGISSGNHPKPVKEKDRYRGSAYTNASPPSITAGATLTAKEGVLRTQRKTASTAVADGHSKKFRLFEPKRIGMTPSPARPMRKRVVPQKF